MEQNTNAPESQVADPAVSEEAQAGVPPSSALTPTSPSTDAHLLAGSFDPVQLRARHDGWTPSRQRTFIEHLADTLCVETAATAVGMSARSAYALRRRAGAEGFAAAWDAALLRGIGEQGRSRLIGQVVNGRLVQRFYHGKLIGQERVYSERLLLALIQRSDELFQGAGAGQVQAIAGDWDGAMDRLEQGALGGGFRVWRDRWGNWMTNYPPPPGLERDTYEGEPSDPDFERPLSEAEEAALAAQQADRVAAGKVARDLFFGFSPRGRAVDRRVRLKK